MPRRARIVAPGLPHHITQRGNNKRLIFFEDEDRMYYLECLQEYSLDFSLTILGYCLMNNHVHFMAIPREADSLAAVFGLLNMRYSQYLNKKMDSSGHLWQGRFFSCVADGPHFVQALKYVERNPVRAGMVSMPWEWEWSSAAEHCGIKTTNLSEACLDEYTGLTPHQWRDYIEASEEVDSVHVIRKSTLSGCPIAVVSCQEKPRRGRPRKPEIPQKILEKSQENLRNTKC